MTEQHQSVISVPALSREYSDEKIDGFYNNIHSTLVSGRSSHQQFPLSHEQNPFEHSFASERPVLPPLSAVTPPIPSFSQNNGNVYFAFSPESPWSHFLAGNQASRTLTPPHVSGYGLSAPFFCSDSSLSFVGFSHSSENSSPSFIPPPANAHYCNHVPRQGRPPNYSSPPSKRKSFLERNRLAAMRSREKKKEKESEMRARLEDLKAENESMTSELHALSDEIFSLKTLLLAHKECPVAIANGVMGLEFVEPKN